MRLILPDKHGPIVFDFKDMSIEKLLDQFFFEKYVRVTRPALSKRAALPKKKLFGKSFNLPHLFFLESCSNTFKDVYKKPDLKIFKIHRNTDI